MEPQILAREKVYGAIQRLLHWWIAALVVALTVMGWISKYIEPDVSRTVLIHSHILLGFGLALGLTMRILWGSIGPCHARLSALWYPSQWWQTLRRQYHPQDEHVGHHPIASLAYLALYGSLIISATTGLILAAIRHDQGPFAEIFFDDFCWHYLFLHVHDFVLYLTTSFIVIHIAGMIIHEQQTGRPTAQSMLSGYQYRTIKGRTK